MTFIDTLLAVLWPLSLAIPLFVLGLSRTKLPWRWLLRGLGGASVVTAVGWLLTLFSGQSVILSGFIHIVPLSATLLLLISLITLVVMRYAHTNFEGDPSQSRFLSYLLVTAVAVMVTVSSNHLLVFWIGWVSISLSLHQLLLFYPNRPRAKLAAHKKFILARVAETLLATALGLLYVHHDTFIISDILASYPSAELSVMQEWAAILIAMVALIKCAQLPIHGWLIQVVEVPTPVSALLHAGVINLGGFLLLLFAPLFSQVLSAQVLILAIAGLSTVLAALVTMTRISVKVRLAWSTAAQMGLMLVECALGLYELALLHLVAHSCYKAHAFLSAGHAVDHYLARQFTGASLPRFKHLFVASFIVAALVVPVVMFMNQALPISPWVLISIALIMVLASRLSMANNSVPRMINSLALIVLLFAAYNALKTLFGYLLPATSFTYYYAADVWVSALFVALFFAYILLNHRSKARVSQRLFVALNAGLYLDEWATRLTLLIWPIRLPRTSRSTSIETLS